MKTIPLTKGQVALVDDADYKWLSLVKWMTEVKSDGRMYAVSPSYLNGRRVLYKRMHTEILGRGRLIDHKDGSGLNNQRENLRPCSTAQNAQAFQRKRNNCSSNYRGVYWETSRKRWRAAIEKDDVGYFLERFNDEIEAAKAYDAAARKLFGEFAAPNFP